MDMIPADSAPDLMVSRTAAEVGCPDDQACNLDCKSACFRVLATQPTPGVFPGDAWPAEVRDVHVGSAEATRDAQIARRETESLSMLNELVGDYRRSMQAVALFAPDSDVRLQAEQRLAEIAERRFIVKVTCVMHCGRKIDHEVTVAQYASNPTHPRMTCGKH